jgi:hypothetical protein
MQTMIKAETFWTFFDETSLVIDCLIDASDILFSLAREKACRLLITILRGYIKYPFTAYLQL